MSARPVQAAGAVVVRGDPSDPCVLVIHRPRYDDWSLPKGKVGRGEEHAAAAIREVREETGVAVELLRELPPTRYTDRRDRPKVVRYWLAQPLGSEPRDPDDEVDEIRWVTLEQARTLLTYAHDRLLLTQLGDDIGGPGSPDGHPRTADRSGDTSAPR